MCVCEREVVCVYCERFMDLRERGVCDLAWKHGQTMTMTARLAPGSSGVSIRGRCMGDVLAAQRLRLANASTTSRCGVGSTHPAMTKDCCPCHAPRGGDQGRVSAAYPSDHTLRFCFGVSSSKGPVTKRSIGGELDPSAKQNQHCVTGGCNSS